MQLWGRIMSGTGPPCCCGLRVAMAMTLTPADPVLATLAGLVLAATLAGLATAAAADASLGARDGGEERTECLSGKELRGRMVGSFFMKASTCRRRPTAGLMEEAPG